MFKYQQTNQFFAQVAGGMEELGADELREMNAGDVRPVYRGIYFTADNPTLYRINYTSRLLSRVLAPLVTFKCHDTDYLYRKAKEIPWESLFTVVETFAVFAQVSNSKITHSRFAALRLKDAIVDHFRQKQGTRPDIDRNHPDAWINLHIENDWATISLDASGGALHRRGYRRKRVEAPMQETLAAAIIRLSEWDGSVPFLDPMCGSGTLLCEALMAYCRIPAGLLRKNFGLRLLPDFDGKEWQAVKMRADSEVRELPHGLIRGSDISKRAIAAAKANLRNIPGGGNVKLKISGFQYLPGLENAVIVCNPPYGIRSGDKEHLPAFYKAFGDYLKQRCTGSTAYIYFGDRQFISHIGLKPSWKIPLVNGALDGRLVKFELY